MENTVDPAIIRKLAASGFNSAWRLMEKVDRTPEEDALMVHTAHASRYLWDQIGTPVNRTRGEWQVSRVYSVLGRGEPCLYHAKRCHAICVGNGIGGFEAGCAFEALGRAYLVLGNPELAAECLQKGREILATLTDSEDIEILSGDLNGLASGIALAQPAVAI